MYIVQHVLDADTYVLKTHTHKKKKTHTGKGWNGNMEMS